MIFRFFKNRLKPKEAGVSLYQRDNGYMLVIDNKTIAGFWIAAEPCIALPIDINNESLGAIIRESLLKSTLNVENPTHHKDAFDFVLKQARVRSYTKFMIGCKLCSIKQKGDTLTFYHSINEGKGFSFTEGPHVTCGLTCSDEQLGKNVIDCFNKSK